MIIFGQRLLFRLKMRFQSSDVYNKEERPLEISCKQMRVNTTVKNSPISQRKELTGGAAMSTDDELFAKVKLYIDDLLYKQSDKKW